MKCWIRLVWEFIIIKPFMLCSTIPFTMMNVGVSTNSQWVFLWSSERKLGMTLMISQIEGEKF